MARRAFTSKQIINKLQEAEVHLSQADLECALTYFEHASLGGSRILQFLPPTF